jgi:hypothetical protein
VSEDQYQIVFNDHPVHAALRQVDQELEDLPSDVLKAISEQDPNDEIPRLERVLDYIGALLGAADPALVTEQMLTNLHDPLQQISSAIPPLRDNQDFAQLQTISNSTGALLNAGVQVAPALGVWSKTKLSRAASNLGEAATTKTRELQEQASKLEGRIGEIREQLEQTSSSIQTTSEERLNELQTQVEGLKTEAQAQKDRVEEAINGIGARFEEEQGTQKTAFEEAQQRFLDAGEAAVNQQQELAENAVKDLAERGKKILSELETQREEATRLVDLVATSSTAGAFGKEAEHQQAEADLWRRNAIYIGLLAAVIGVAAVIASFVVNASPSVIVAKVAAVALLVGIAGYAAGQSGQHRRREQRAKRLELELVAFGPFSEPLSDEAKLEVRKDFIERLFVGDPGDERHQEQSSFSEEQLSALATIANLLQVAQKSS